MSANYYLCNDCWILATTVKLMMSAKTAFTSAKCWAKHTRTHTHTYTYTTAHDALKKYKQRSGGCMLHVESNNNKNNNNKIVTITFSWNKKKASIAAIT